MSMYSSLECSLALALVGNCNDSALFVTLGSIFNFPDDFASDGILSQDASAAVVPILLLSDPRPVDRRCTMLCEIKRPSLLRRHVD